MSALTFFGFVWVVIIWYFIIKYGSSIIFFLLGVAVMSIVGGFFIGLGAHALVHFHILPPVLFGTTWFYFILGTIIMFVLLVHEMLSNQGHHVPSIMKGFFNFLLKPLKKRVKKHQNRQWR